ncbi:Protein CBG19085 [Caenorhabditis briggsae]|uniref:Protein CBG19085 n=1 Tax=Caenorhabditis briggsae TaxID=6238 RepID=A8XUR4_CAEBR|nr:Protein CBG19085 [Caenorhabditis briggsae]CAP36389.2 Protein CBG19085 [Caenorhabditis briggsae]
MIRQQLIGLSLIPPSIFGFVSNWTIVIIVIRYRNLHRSFAILTATLAFLYAICSTFDLFFVSPMIILNLQFLKEYSAICGSYWVLAYDATSQFHLVVSINRFIAVFAPLSYSTYFNPRTTKISIAFLFALSATLVGVYIFGAECSFSFNDDRWAFLITESEKCDILGWAMLWGKGLTLSVIDVILHIVTFIRIFWMKRSTFGQTVFMSIEIVAYIFPAEKMQKDYIAFLCSSFLWCTIHAAEGVITLIYNSEIRRKFRKRKISYRISAVKRNSVLKKVKTDKRNMQDPQFVGLSLFPISLFGMVFNWLVTIIIIKEKTIFSPFMLLTLVKSFCDACYVTIYFFYITPMIVLANKFLIHHSNHAGYALIVFYEISIHIHFLTSFNRFIAVFVPFSYKNMFSIRSTSLYLIVISVLSFTMMTVVIYGLGCELEYNPVTWVSFYDTTIPVCGFYAIYLDFMKNMIVVSADFIIDVVTILKVQKMRKKFREGKRSENYTKKEADFLKQTFGQGICYLMGYASYLMVPEMNSNKYVAFFMSLVSWDLIATIDGMFTIVYNAEIRNRIFKSSVTTAAGSTVVSVNN